MADFHTPEYDDRGNLIGVDRTLGGMVYDDEGQPTGWKLRGQSELAVIERMERRAAVGGKRDE